MQVTSTSRIADPMLPSATAVSGTSQVDGLGASKYSNEETLLSDDMSKRVFQEFDKKLTAFMKAREADFLSRSGGSGEPFKKKRAAKKTTPQARKAEGVHLPLPTVKKLVEALKILTSVIESGEFVDLLQTAIETHESEEK